MLTAIFLIGVTEVVAIPLIGVWLAHLAKGYHDTNLGVKMNDAISSKSRASILSFNTLVSRLLSALYIALAGFLLASTSFFITMMATVFIISVLVGVPHLIFNKDK